MKKIIIILLALLCILDTYAQNAVESFNVNGVSFEMIYVKGGTFMMGIPHDIDPDADPDYTPNPETQAHKVTLSDFYIGKYEVTQKLWKAVMGNENNPSGNKKGGNYPVENVSWNEIVNDFLPKLNQMTGKTFVLPTEAQWEFAARGGIKRHDKSDGSPLYEYAGSNNIDDVAWYGGSRDLNITAHGVGHKKPNELGIYDMSGNVSEWCYDWFVDYPATPQINPQGPKFPQINPQGLKVDRYRYRVDRGGNYNSDASYCAVSSRGGLHPDYCFYDSGFRLAMFP